jgi:hypothetical protein
VDIISIFNNIRDLPYKIPLSLNEEDVCCSGKHKILKDILIKHGYKARYRVCSFQWDSINLPPDILNIPHENFSTHVYLEIFINGKWLDMDTTWDSGLKSIFPINEWDGNQNIIAVPVIKKFSLKKSQEIMNNEDKEEIIKDLKINGEFYKALNNWFTKIRKSL